MIKPPGNSASVDSAGLVPRSTSLAYPKPHSSRLMRYHQTR
jgi:hypothetical protein